MSQNQYTEGSPWFWKIFGGTILGMITLLLLALFNNINSSIDRTKHEFTTIATDLRVEIRENRQALDSYRDRLVALEQNTLKDRFEATEKLLNQISEKVSSVETSLNLFKEEMKVLKDENKELRTQLQELREKFAVESGKKDNKTP